MVDQPKQKGLLRGKWAILDGTKVITHAAVKSHLALVREGRKKLVKVLARYDEPAARELAVLANRNGIPTMPNTKRSWRPRWPKAGSC